MFIGCKLVNLNCGSIRPNNPCFGHFPSFQIDFNNEVVYSLSDEAKGVEEECFGNINLMTAKDTRKGETIMKINSFHSLNTGSVLFGKLSGRKLTELKIPFNDIITIRSGNKEVHIEFRNKSLFVN